MSILLVGLVSAPVHYQKMLAAFPTFSRRPRSTRLKFAHMLASPPLERLRYLTTAQEAYGAFRLPIPPESGYIPGVLVKSEPFVAPADELELRQQARANSNNVIKQSEQAHHEKKIDLGIVYHRGNPTSQMFRVNVQDLTRHALIAGSTGSGKSTTIKNVLAQLWTQHRIPFLVLYPIDKPDYRELRGFQGLANDLLVFTLGDETTSPFRFNPFEVPEGLLLKTHLSRLMRVFMSAFSLHDPLPMIYREALRRVYAAYGWNPVLDQGVAGRDYPIMSDFYKVIGEITDSLKYGREVQDTVRQASVIRIADLLENAGHVVNVQRSMSLSTILNQPTVMELGRVGSAQDTALLMGFLLMRFAEEVERNPRKPHEPHITVVEEAHRLMAETGPATSGSGDSRGAAGEDFSNILAEVRGHGEGIIIAEQMPTLLVKGAIGNTYLKLMHWLEDPPSFELFGSVMNMNEAQREYARTLTPGFAVVRSPYGKPVHIKVPEFGDQQDFSPEAARYIKDQHIRAFMQGRRKHLGLSEVPVVVWAAGLPAVGAEQETAATRREAAERILRAPLHSCVFCKPMLEQGKCPFRPDVLKLQADAQGAMQRRNQLAEAAVVDDATTRWTKIGSIGRSLRLDEPGAVYCYLAHEVDRHIDRSTPSAIVDKDIRKLYRRMLREFDDQYPEGR